MSEHPIKTRHQKYYKANREVIKEKNKRYYAKNKRRYAEHRRKQYAADPEGHKARERRRYARMRKVVLAAYGDICVCCGEAEVLFLELDHKLPRSHPDYPQGSGAGKRLVAWAIAHDFPDSLQILCANCNQGKKRNGGTCPHKAKSGR